MSKTFENNAQKALDMAAGLRKNLAQVATIGVRAEVLDRIETESRAAIEMSREVDALREEVSQKLQAANAKLAEVKELAMPYRTLVKCNFPPEKW